MCESTKNSLDQLKLLTPLLPEIPNLVDLISIPDTIINYNIPNGTSLGFKLLFEDKVAVQKHFLSLGSKFPTHLHENSIECLIVYEGKLKVTIDNEEIVKVLTPGESINIPKNSTHKVQALEDTWLIGVIIPKEDGYPQ